MAGLSIPHPCASHWQTATKALLCCWVKTEFGGLSSTLSYSLSCMSPQSVCPSVTVYIILLLSHVCFVRWSSCHWIYASIFDCLGRVLKPFRSLKALKTQCHCTVRTWDTPAQLNYSLNINIFICHGGNSSRFYP